MEQLKEDLLKIIKHYGVNAQQRQFAEEVFELQEAIYQYIAQKEACENIGCSTIHVDKCKERIAEEIVDVMIMLNQFKAYYEIPNETILVFMREKVDRQLERIKNEVKE